MNYSKVNWTNQTAITKDSLDKMDSGIAALSQESADFDSRIATLESASIITGAVKITSGSETSSSNVKKVDVTISPALSQIPRVFVTALSSRPDITHATVSNVSTTGFTIYLYHTGSFSGYDAWVQYMILKR